MSIQPLKSSLLSLAVAAVCGLPATADDSKDKQNQDRQSKQQRQAHDGQQAQKSQQAQKDRKTMQNNKQSSSSRDGKVRTVPVRWVTVAVDYNLDGWYDGWETIYYYDFEQARQRSQQRSQSGSQQAGNQGPQRASIQGEIVALTTEKSRDGKNQRMVAQIKNSQGRKAEVCLGPQDTMSKLNLSKGDEVSAEGVLMRKNGQMKLIAARVESNGQTVTHKLTKRPMISRLKGELTNLSEATSKRGDGQYLVGKVKTDQGTRTVHFGPKKQLSKLNLSEGDQVSVISRTGSVSGKKATLALQVSANDHTVKIARQGKRSGGNQSSKQDRGSRSNS